MTQFAERLKSARVMAGLSLQDLAERLQNRVTRQALHKYEKGEFMPDGEMLGLLCEALGVRPDYFFRKAEVNLENVEFRKHQKFPVKEKKSIIEKTRDFLSRYIELEEILGINTKFELGFEIKPLTSKKQVEDVAIALREKWSLGTGPIFNLIELVEDNHIKVIEIETEDDGMEGISAMVNGSFPVIVINKGTANRKKPLDRIRFTALHELAHIILPLDHYSQKEKEKFCHYFAAAMLLPKEAIKKEEIGYSRSKLLIPELGALKQQYGISIQAIAYRLKDLGVITDSYFKQFMFLMTHLGYRVDEPFPYPGYEESNRFNQLLFKALAEEYISMSKAASLKNKKLAEFRSEFLAA
jgi:Zn-dependent peptidase ImmA (M78 family)/DNA-binding XRE family transcriptional regulator